MDARIFGYKFFTLNLTINCKQSRNKSAYQQYVSILKKIDKKNEQEKSIFKISMYKNET